MYSIFSTTFKHFLADQPFFNYFFNSINFFIILPPIETWSSYPCAVGIVSLEAGWDKVLFSEVRAAAIY